METSSQDKYRIALIEKYESRAFECLALYNYYGRNYEAIEKGCKDLDARSEEAEAKIKEIEAQEGSHENYEKIKALKEDIKKFEKQIASVGEMGKKFFEKAASYQEEGGRILEQIEEFKVFKLKTPEQIAADKAPKSEPKKEITTLLSLFKIEGHNTYRVLLNKHEADFTRQIASPNFPKITERKVFIVDKINGTIKEIK